MKQEINEYEFVKAFKDINRDYLTLYSNMWDYSVTPRRHFKAFINEYTPFNYENKQQWLKEIANNDKIQVIQMEKQIKLDWCNNCDRCIKQEEIKEGVFGCEYCKTNNNISILDVTDYIYEMEEE